MSGLPELPPHLSTRYNAMELIGQGGAAVVYRAHDLVLDRDVAVKFLRDDWQLGRSWERFAQEIRSLEELQHPSIIPVLDSGCVGDTVYYVMPLADGTLAQRLRRMGPLPVAEVRRLAEEMLGALSTAHAHPRQLVHRDLKPLNILVAGEHFWLADFGIARFLQREEASRFTPSGIRLGSPEYMSPEQLLGSTVDHRSDLYSLGLVLYECLAGIHAFPSRTPDGSVRMRLAQEATPVRSHRPDVDGALEQVVMRALRAEPAERWAAAPEMRQALD